MKALLTSCGLETETIKNKFIGFLDKDVSEIKAIFIPTAAIKVDAINVLPKCMNDLIKCGITKQNILIYDLHRPMLLDELLNYDVVYICGGDTKYLLDRMNENEFGRNLQHFIKENKIVVGVSAGSVIFAGNLQNNLGLLHQNLNVHCSDKQCNAPGYIDMASTNPIKLGNQQGIVFESENVAYIIN